MFPAQKSILRLCFKIHLSPRYFSNKFVFKRTDINVQLSELLDLHSSKIIYSSYLEDDKLKLGYIKNKILESKQLKDESKLVAARNVTPFPVSLKYVTDDFNTQKELCDNEDNVNDEEPELPYFPFNTAHRNEFSNEEHIITKTEETGVSKSSKSKEEKLSANWMTDYEIYNDSIDDIDSSTDTNKNYGSPDPSYTKKGPPCGGCGANLHCVAPNQPGYLPSQLFKHRSKDELKSVTCQRCHFLKNYNISLNLTVQPSEYVRLISSIKDKFALAILMVDLLDFPCSIWPDIKGILGTKRPVFVVGNKVDLLPKDSKGYLNNVLACLEEAIINAGINKTNIKHTCLISAKTNHGIEELITKLHSEWGTKGDVYIVGCTNVGKSSLFNALLKSDYCKVQATDLIQRATASPWPGTTLNMLKFPIMRPSGYRLYLRTQRLIKERANNFAEQKLRKLQLRGSSKVEYATLIGHIGHTFKTDEGMVEGVDPFSMGGIGHPIMNKIGINEHDKDYKMSKWCYDTPGVVQQDQVLHLLTTDELLHVLPSEMIRIRNFSMREKQSLFLAGLGRVDYVEGDQPIIISVFAANSLPILICPTEHSSGVYSAFIGTEPLGVPFGSEARLQKWPGLSLGNEVTVTGLERGKAIIGSFEPADYKYQQTYPNPFDKDLLLSSSGWVSVTTVPNSSATLQQWTPEGRGAYTRTNSLLQYPALLKGKRVRGTPVYRVINVFKQ